MLYVSFVKVVVEAEDASEAGTILQSELESVLLQEESPLRSFTLNEVVPYEE